LQTQAKEIIRACALQKLTFQCLFLDEEWACAVLSKEPGV
jgi:hypothetical protein